MEEGVLLIELEADIPEYARSRENGPKVCSSFKLSWLFSWLFLTERGEDVTLFNVVRKSLTRETRQNSNISS